MRHRECGGRLEHPHVGLTLAFIVLWSVAGFGLSRLRRRLDTADALWGSGVSTLALLQVWAHPAPGGFAILLALLVSIWGGRLSAHIWERQRRKPEDPRYAAFRRHPFLQVHLLQTALMPIVALPVSAALGQVLPTGPWPWIGIGLWAFGMGYATLADTQLRRFLTDPANRGSVLDTGLWGLSRHPNYFGEALGWWGLGLASASTGAWWALASPVLVTYLLRYVSGVPLHDRRRAGNPAYARYLAEVPAMWPRWRRA